MQARRLPRADDGGVSVGRHHEPVEDRQEDVGKRSFLPTTGRSRSRFAHERDLLKHLKIVKVPKSVVVCQGAVRQATTLQRSMNQVVTASVPTRDLVSQGKEDWKKKELVQLAKR